MMLAVALIASRAAFADGSVPAGEIGQHRDLDAASAPIEFAWAGALTPTSVRVNAKSRIDGGVRLHVGTSADLAGARVSDLAAALASTNNRVVSIRDRKSVV